MFRGYTKQKDIKYDVKKHKTEWRIKMQCLQNVFELNAYYLKINYSTYRWIYMNILLTTNQKHENIKELKQNTKRKPANLKKYIKRRRK